MRYMASIGFNVQNVNQNSCEKLDILFNFLQLFSATQPVFKKCVAKAN